MSIEIGGVEVFSLEEVSKRLGVEAEALKRLMRRGDLVARKIGDQWFVTSQNLLAFLQTPASPSKRTLKHARHPEEHPTLPLPDAVEPAAETTPPAPALEETIVSAAPGAALRLAEPAPPSNEIAKPETVFPHQLPKDIPADPVPPPATTALKATEPVLPSVVPPPAANPEPILASTTDAPAIAPSAPGVLESEKPTDINVAAVQLPAHLAAPRPNDPATTPTLIAPSPAEKPAAPSGPGEALAALFDLPVLPPDEPVMSTLQPPAAAELSPAEQRKAMAIEATRRRAQSGGGDDAPGALPGGSSHRRTLLDSEEMPSVPADAAGAARAAEAHTATATAPPPAPGARLSDIPNMFGPDSPTVLLTPEQVEADAVRTKQLLMDAMEQGRIAQRARDEIVATVRKLPLEEQSFALAGPIGEQLVKLDRMIEDGVRAQKELGLPVAPQGANVVTAVHRSPESAPAHEENSKWLPIAAQTMTDPVPLIVPQSDPAIPVAQAPRAPVEKKPSSRVGPVGGETWQEVGLPVPKGPHAGPGHAGGIVRLTLSLSDEEKRVLSDNRIAEETAVQEIMRRYQPTDEKGWSDAKGRYFQPLRSKGGVKA